MKIVCLQENLKNSLGFVQGIVGHHLTLPILNNVLLQADKSNLQVMATNLEMAMVIDLAARIEISGSLTVPARLMVNLISSLKEKKIALESRPNNNLFIKTQNYQANLRGLASKDFPLMPKIDKQYSFKIPATAFKIGLAGVINSVALTETRPEISGVLFVVSQGELKIASTDSFRLAEKRVKIEGVVNAESSQVIIPAKTIQELIKVLSVMEKEVEVVVGASQILFNCHNIKLISRLIEGAYPDYQAIIPQDFQTQVILDKKEFLEMVKIASLFSSKINDVTVLVDPKKSQVEISAQNIDVGENQINLNAEISGQAVKVVCNYRYLLEGLSNILSPRVFLGFNGSAQAFVMKPVQQKGYLYLIMPLNQ